MIGRRIAQQDKAGIILVLTAACFGLTYFFHHELGSGRLFTHFCYVPSILAVIWWGWRALPVSLILAGFLVFSSNWFRIDPVSANDTIRAVLFLFIVSTVALLSDGIRRARHELHESEKRYKAVFDNLNFGVTFYRVEDNGRRIVVQELNHAAQTAPGVGLAGEYTPGRDHLLYFNFQESPRRALKRRWSRTISGTAVLIGRPAMQQEKGRLHRGGGGMEKCLWRQSLLCVEADA